METDEETSTFCASAALETDLVGLDATIAFFVSRVCLEILF